MDCRGSVQALRGGHEHRVGRAVLQLTHGGDVALGNIYAYVGFAPVLLVLNRLLAYSAQDSERALSKRNEATTPSTAASPEKLAARAVSHQSRR